MNGGVMSNGVPFLQKAAWVAACVQVAITCLQVVTVIVSVYFVWSQLNQQRANLDQQVKLSRAANTQTLAGLITPVNLKITDREMAELWVNGFEGIKQISDKHEQEIQKERYEALLVSTLIFYENVYSQNSAELVDSKIYDAWDKALIAFLDAPGMPEFWKERKKFYRKDFSDHVDEIFACLNSTPRQPLCQ
jgi:hypothetical protein